MAKNHILSIPVVYQDGQQEIEVLDQYIQIYPFDTPLQIAYRFCTQNKLEFNYISPLSKQIIQFVQQTLDHGKLDRICSNAIRLHFDKFINNINIRESIKGLDNTIKIVDNKIVIGSTNQMLSPRIKIEDNTVDFSFECEKINEQFEENQENHQNLEESSDDQYQFSFKNKLIDFLNPTQKHHHESKADIFLRKNSFTQIQNMQKFEQMNNKIINRMKNASPLKSQMIPYNEYLRQRDRNIDRSNITSRDQSANQSPLKNTVQTLPKGRISIEKGSYRSRDVSPASFVRLAQESSIQSSINSNGTVQNNKVNQSKINRAQSFKDLMKKIQRVSTPQKSQRVQDICIKQQTITTGKIEQKINEVFSILDSNKDGYIDHNINLQQFKQHVIDQFEPIWFQILLKKIKVSRGVYQQMMQKRIKELDANEVKKFIFNGIKK